MKTWEYLVHLNFQYSDEFNSPASVESRREYRKNHPTWLGAFLCMDGRIGMHRLVGTPPGIIQKWRTMGAHTSLGWDGCALPISGWVQAAKRSGNDCVVFVTYHFSENAPHRGCAGFHYNTEEARTAAGRLKEQVDRVFGSHGVYTIQCGIETDSRRLVVSLEIDKFSRFPDHVRRDIMPLFEANRRHAQETENHGALDHRERAICFGNGINSWLSEENVAIIISLFEREPEKAISVAAGLLRRNLEEERIQPEDGLAFLACASYDPSLPWARALAREQAQARWNLGIQIIQTEHPDLYPLFRSFIGVVSHETRRLEIVSSELR